MSSQVTIYRTAWCPFCHRAEALLAKKSIANLESVDLDETPDQRAVMVEKAGRTSVPQIFINGVHIGGCDDLMALERDGKLDPMLAA
ncbi:MAG: glutaredoxin 3 [Burkholderiaceae bacterium]